MKEIGKGPDTTATWWPSCKDVSPYCTCKPVYSFGKTLTVEYSHYVFHGYFHITVFVCMLYISKRLEAGKRYFKCQ